MRTARDGSEAARQYAIAYAAHYVNRDLPRAFQQYRSILQSHTESVEATYCRMQLENIINHVVPKQKLEDVQISLLLQHFEAVEVSTGKRDPPASRSSENGSQTKELPAHVVPQ